MPNIYPWANPSGRGYLPNTAEGTPRAVEPGFLGMWRRPWYSSRTQVLANYLPEHTAIRTEKTSVGQEVLNVLGTEIEKVELSWQRVQRNLFVSLADLNQPGALLRFDLPAAFIDRSVEVTHNLVRNSSAEISTNALRLPDYWRSQNATVEIVDDGVVGRKSFKVQPNAGTAWLYNSIDRSAKSGAPFTASVWYKTTQVTGTTASKDNFALVLRLHKQDGTWDESIYSVLSKTVSNWSRAVVTGFAPANVTDIEIGIRQSTDFSEALYVDCFQLEFGSSPSSWEPHIWDAPMWLGIPTRLPGFRIEDDIPIYPVLNETDLWFVPPTRCSYAGAYPRPISVPATAGYVEEIDYTGRRYIAEWKPNGTQVRKLGRADQAADIYGDFNLALPSWDGELLDASITAVEAATQFNSMVWIVVRAANYLGATKRFLIVANPRYPRPTPTYLECVTCLELPSEIPTVYSARFLQANPSYILLSDGAVEYGVQLHYDVGYYRADFNDLFVREYRERVTPLMLHNAPPKEIRTNFQRELGKIPKNIV